MGLPLSSQLLYHEPVFEPEVLDAYEQNDNVSMLFGVTATRCYRALQISCKYTKASTHPTALKILFLNHLVEEHSDSIHISLTVQNRNMVQDVPHLALELQ